MSIYDTSGAYCIRQCNILHGYLATYVLKGGVIDNDYQTCMFDALNVWSFSQVRPPFVGILYKYSVACQCNFIWGNQVHACTRPFFAPLDMLREIKQELDHRSGLLTLFCDIQSLSHLS